MQTYFTPYACTLATTFRNLPLSTRYSVLTNTSHLGLCWDVSPTPHSLSTRHSILNNTSRLELVHESPLCVIVFYLNLSRKAIGINQYLTPCGDTHDPCIHHVIPLLQHHNEKLMSQLRGNTLTIATFAKVI